MYLAAIGALELKHWRHGPEFAWRTRASLKQARANGDCLHAQVFPRGPLFFSLTVWTDAKAMKRFALSGPHREAMRAALRLSRPLHFHHFACDAPPTPDEAVARWQAATPAQSAPAV